MWLVHRTTNDHVNVNYLPPLFCQCHPFFKLTIISFTNPLLKEIDIFSMFYYSQAMISRPIYLIFVHFQKYNFRVKDHKHLIGYCQIVLSLL
jgi:hypothetical protein